MKGIIYKIACNVTGEVYYGSTYTTLSKRMGCHLSDSEHMCVCVQILMRDNYTTSIVKEVEYEDLLWEERWAIEADSKAINIKVPIITDRERQDIHNKATNKWRTTEDGIEYTKAYSYNHYHDNKEECLAKNKAYRQTEKGKESKAKSDKKYREGPAREELLAKKREDSKARRENQVQVTCECGGVFFERGRNRHLKTKKHQDFNN